MQAYRFVCVKCLKPEWHKANLKSDGLALSLRFKCYVCKHEIAFAVGYVPEEDEEEDDDD